MDEREKTKEGRPSQTGRTFPDRGRTLSRGSVTETKRTGVSENVPD